MCRLPLGVVLIRHPLSSQPKPIPRIASVVAVLRPLDHRPLDKQRSCQYVFQFCCIRIAGSDEQRVLLDEGALVRLGQITRSSSGENTRRPVLYTPFLSNPMQTLAFLWKSEQFSFRVKKGSVKNGTKIRPFGMFFAPQGL